jgi:transposase-like protein
VVPRLGAWLAVTHLVIHSFVNVGSPTTLSSPVCAGICVLNFSYRDLAELVRELGVCVAPSTILRWVVRYVPEFEKCWQAYERPVGDSWRVDETYLKVGGQWMYLYRAVDKKGKTVESYLESNA